MQQQSRYILNSGFWQNTRLYKNAKETILKEIKVSFIVHFWIGKYSFRLDTFLQHISYFEGNEHFTYCSFLSSISILFQHNYLFWKRLSLSICEYIYAYRGYFVFSQRIKTALSEWQRTNLARFPMNKIFIVAQSNGWVMEKYHGDRAIWMMEKNKSAKTRTTDTKQDPWGFIYLEIEYKINKDRILGSLFSGTPIIVGYLMLKLSL